MKERKGVDNNRMVNEEENTLIYKEGRKEGKVRRREKVAFSFDIILKYS